MANGSRKIVTEYRLVGTTRNFAKFEPKNNGMVGSMYIPLERWDNIGQPDTLTVTINPS